MFGGVQTCVKGKFTLENIKNRTNYTDLGDVVSQLGGGSLPPLGDVKLSLTPSRGLMHLKQRPE